MNFETYYQARAQRIEHFLDRILPTQGGQTALDEPTRHLMPTPEPRIDPGARQLYAAMRYSVLGGGKRLRPLLVYATGEALGAPLEYLDAAAAAVELIHCYSLIHDDLPAMDNDTLRRGKATCHIAFDEATAVLTGDALQCLAFELLANPDLNPISSLQQIKMIQILSKNSGMRGMVQGQMLDMHYAKRSTPSPQLEDLSNIHGKKTGALIEAAVLCGLYAARPHPESAHLLAFQNYAQKLGLCFQIQDDIQDVLGNPEMLGKHTGQDKAQGKATFPGQLGVEASFQMLQALQIEMEATINFSSTLEKHLLELFHFFIQGLFGTAASKP